MSESRIRWPEEFHPSRAPIHVTNSRDSAAPPSAVWACLVRARDWPKWYPNSHNVSIEGGGDRLEAGSTFRWSTFGVALVSHVVEFVPGERIAWNARGIGVWAYHAWLIEPKGAGSSILTEETQYGVIARLGNLLMPNRMKRGHDLWLEVLDRSASASTGST